MPTGPKGQKRPRDTNQLAKLMVDILTGQVEDREPTPEEQGKDPAAVVRGKLGGVKGGSVRAANLTKDRRVEIARKAAKTRWKTSAHNE
jgi:predicted FMN-binding regulatory protein PaiB